MLGLVRAMDPRQSEWNFLGFIDDGIPAGTPVDSDVTLGGIERLTSAINPTAVVMGLADSKAKAAIYEKLSQNPKLEFPVLVHPLAYVEPTASLAPGVIVSPFCFVAVKSRLGICSFLNYTSQVGHDAVLGDFCSVMPSACISGNVVIGAQTLVGAGAKILQGLNIGKNSVVGIGSVVLNDVPDDCTVLGYPARVVKKNRR